VLTLGRNAHRTWMFITNIRGIHIGAVHPTSLLPGGGFEASSAGTGRRSVIRVSRGATTFISLYDAQQRNNAGSVWDSRECSAGGSPGGGE
jgi:hypothetical protein